MELQQIIMVVHVLIALAIVGLVLLQQGKGADMGASFGAGSSQTVFGGVGGGNMLTKATAVLAASFFATSFALAIVAKNIASESIDLDAAAIPAVVEESAPQPGAEVPGAAQAPEIPEAAAGAAPDSEIPASNIPGVDD
jgi:preprotein translocase subunit SecG